MTKITIASGKGGTGKTTVSINLYYYLSKLVSKNITLIDCDVEEPNDALFFPEATIEKIKEVYQLVPEINVDKCTFCKRCSEWCEFNAISVVKNLKFAKVNTDLCHSCGACSVACRNNAIIEKEQPLGSISYYNTGIGNRLIEGRLKIGSAMQTALIKKVKKEIHGVDSFVIYDSPPGTSCQVVETISDADYVILVTEPTPFGLHDLKITVELLKNIQKPFGVIVNKAGLGSNEVYGFLKSNNIELLAKIPFLKDYATQYSSGCILENIPPEIDESYRILVNKLKTIFPNETSHKTRKLQH